MGCTPTTGLCYDTGLADQNGDEIYADSCGNQYTGGDPTCGGINASGATPSMPTSLTPSTSVAAPAPTGAGGASSILSGLGGMFSGLGNAIGTVFKATNPTAMVQGIGITATGVNQSAIGSVVTSSGLILVAVAAVILYFIFGAGRRRGAAA